MIQNNDCNTDSSQPIAQNCISVHSSHSQSARLHDQQFNCSLLLLLHPFNGLFSTTTCVSQQRKGKTSLDLNEARDDDGVLGCNGISWNICKQSAPYSRQITTPTLHHSILYRPDALPDAQPTMSKHQKLEKNKQIPRRGNSCKNTH